MDPLSQPKSVRVMSAEERRSLLRRRTAAEGERSIEIGVESPGRRLVRVAGRLIVLGLLAAVFVATFYRFTASWRVAALVVGAMGGYMLLIGRMVEGRAGRIE